jgi:GT2 family glycosyltransferase
MSLPSYVLITSVKDEATHLETVMASLAAQDTPPLRWYITDDGSTDASPGIIRSFLKAYPFICLIQKPSRPKGARSFGSQYANMNDMFTRAKKELGDRFDYLAVHDADVAVEEDFYTRLLSEAVKDPTIGAVGGVVYQPTQDGRWRPRSVNAAESLPGSALFSRKCFEAVGGYVPKEFGESDWLFQIDMLRLGFKVKVVPAAVLYEYRRTSNMTIKGSFKAGKMDASLGSDPVFELMKCARRALHSPLGLCGFLRLAGYLHYRATHAGPSVEPERYNFLRSLQRARLPKLLRSIE